jgi:gluconolactonase
VEPDRDLLAGSIGPARLITAGLSLPEAPVLLPDGSVLVAELDMPLGDVLRIAPDGTREPIATTGRPNGLALSRDGSVWVAESLEPGLLRLQLSGEFTRELEEVEGRPLLWPNDLCWGPDGALYATDSGILVGDLLKDGTPVDCAEDVITEGTVFRYDPGTKEATLIDDGLGFANGIAFGPDGLLYANETLTGDVWRYRIERGRPIREPELFGNVMEAEVRKPGLIGPDGMAFSVDGRLWVAVYGRGELAVLDPAGEVERRIPTDGDFPTNLAFGLNGDPRIYVVEDERGSLSSMEVGVGGLPLYD